MIPTDNDKLESGRDTSARPWLYASITITILLVGLLTWHLVYSYNLLTSFKNREFVTQQSSWKLRLNAETMRLSALVSSSTGDLKWKEDYQKIRVKIGPTLQQIRDLTQSPEVDRLTGEIEEHLEIITEIEDEAFALVRRGKKNEAFKLLSGWQYTKNQRKFSYKIKSLVDLIREHLERKTSFGPTRASLPIVFGGFVLLIFFWTITLKNWRIQTREKQAAEKALRQSVNLYRAIFATSGTAMFIIEEDTTISLANTNFEKLSGYSREELEDNKSWTEFVHPDDVEWMKKKHYLRRQDPYAAPRQYEFRFITRHEEERNVLLAVDMIFGTNRSIASCIDITERKQTEEKLKEMSFHDSLTGLYNRNFFEEEMVRLGDGRYDPVGIMICDLDGLKFVNDTLGHEAGDQMLITTAEILRQNFRSSDIIARIGGDEFAVMLQGTHKEVVEQIQERIRKSLRDYNNTEPEIPLSFSIGHALGRGDTADMHAIFREADNRMYREKIQREGSARNAILQALTVSMEARDFNTENHCDRLQELAASLARSLNLTLDVINDLYLLARFHDLGKVGIPDSILNKPGSLTEEEWRQMRQHCEIGHRIASSVPDLEPIADFILKHHECWDGQGYPMGMSGEDIPLPCRILAIADAYDAMISDRPYRKAMSREDAIAELKRCAGTQFDPDLVEKFIQVLDKFDSE